MAYPINRKLNAHFIEDIMEVIFVARLEATGSLIPSKKPDYEAIKAYIESQEKDKGHIESIVNSVVNKLVYEPDNRNYFYLASLLLDRIAIGHCFLDGNKRTALNTGNYILRVFVNNSIKDHINWENFPDFMVYLIENHTNWDEREQVRNTERFLLVNELKGSTNIPSKISEPEHIWPVLYNEAIKDRKNPEWVKMMDRLDRI